MIAVIGCGNPNRSDDGAGVEVVHALAARGPREGVRLLDAGTDGMAVLFGARGCTSLIVVDACRTGAAPGAVFELPGSEAEARHEASYNLHDFRWDHALYAGRLVLRERFPSDVVVLLIEGRAFGLGLGVCEEVARARDLVCARIEALLAERLEPARATGARP